MSGVQQSNPDRLVRQYLRANFWSHWAAQPAEALFLAAACLGFGAFALWIADPHWQALLNPRAPWVALWPAMAIGLVLGVLFLLRHRRQRQTAAEQQRWDWLAALPIDAHLRRSARATHAAAISSALLLLLGVLLAWAYVRAGHPARTLPLALIVGASGAVFVALLWPEPRRPARAKPTREHAQAVRIPAQTQGLALLGAALEPAAARLPRSAPWVALSFLLLPPSTPFLAVIALVFLFTALSLALDLVGHWRTRYLRDYAWLAAQPLPATRLLAAYLPYLARRGAALLLLFTSCLLLLRTPVWFALLAGALLAASLVDAVLCGFATRREPQRFALLLCVHAVIVLASTQVLPPAMPLVWIICAIGAWRKGRS